MAEPMATGDRYGFKPGDRVSRSFTPGRSHSLFGTFVGETRDGRCYRVLWDGTVHPQAINKGHIRLVESADGAADGAAGEGEGGHG